MWRARSKSPRRGQSYDVNQLYFVERFALEHKVLFEMEEGFFYLYNSVNGAWERASNDAIKLLVSEDWLKMAMSEFAVEGLCCKGTNDMLSGIVSGIRARVGKKGIFKRLRAKDPHDGLIHVANGMLTIKADGPNGASGFELSPFSPDYYSRNPLAFEFNPAARCPKFEALLKHSLPQPGEHMLYVVWFGGCLIQGNPAQKIMLLIGKPNTSKSVLLSVTENVIGLRNSTTLRTHLLDQRFELARFAGKTLLTAKDVRGDFLEHASAQMIKALCGTDRQIGEFKNSMEQIDLGGDYHMGISSNETLLVRLRGETDAQAWARRLLLLHFLHPIERVIDRYHEVLLAEEGPGIFGCAVRGAQRYLRWLKRYGKIGMTEEQRKRVDNLVFQSQSLERFVATEIVSDENYDLTTEEIVEAYVKYCHDRKWVTRSTATIEKRLVDQMLTTHGSLKSKHVERDGIRVDLNGYPNVRWA